MKCSEENCDKEAKENNFICKEHLQNQIKSKPQKEKKKKPRLHGIIKKIKSGEAIDLEESSLIVQEIFTLKQILNGVKEIVFQTKNEHPILKLISEEFERLEESDN